MTNERALQTMVMSSIVDFYNEYAERPVTKFEDKATAVRRTAAVLDAAGMQFDEVCQLRPVGYVPPAVAAETPSPVTTPETPKTTSGAPKLVKIDGKNWQCGDIHVTFDKREDPYVARRNGEVVATEYKMSDMKRAVTELMAAVE